jgi:hypothetical protein
LEFGFSYVTSNVQKQKSGFLLNEIEQNILCIEVTVTVHMAYRDNLVIRRKIKVFSEKTCERPVKNNLETKVDCFGDKKRARFNPQIIQRFTKKKIMYPSTAFSHTFPESDISKLGKNFQ